MDDKLHRNKYSWWERRTKTEKYLIAIVSFAAIVIIYLASNLLMTFSASSENIQQNVCMSEKCIRLAARILNKIDKTIDPCDDFYKFACGNFIKNTIIPDDKTSVSSVPDITDKVTLQLMKVFEEPVSDTDPHSLKLTKAIYNSCMNTDKIEKEGLAFIKREFKDLGGWPIIDPYWSEKTFDWKNLLYRLQRIGWMRDLFFNIYVHTDLKNSTRNIVMLTQPNMEYETLKKGFNDTSVKASYDDMVEFAVLFGAERAAAILEMKDVIDFEIELAKMLVPYEEREHATLEYNLITIKEFQRNFSSLPWLKLINNYLSPNDILTPDDVINVRLPQYFKRLEPFLAKLKKRTIANYVFSKIIRDSRIYLPEQFREKELKYLNQVTPRWKTCVLEASRQHIAVSSLYIKRFFNNSIKNKVTELATDIKSSFLETLRNIGWMDRKTKKHAILKAEKMNLFVGYPDELLDDRKVEDYYQGLELDGDEYFLKILFNLSAFWHSNDIKKLREPVVKPDWRDQSYISYVNAFYSQSENTIELPAAILQDHFFDPERPQYMNYGAIGEVIGHQITHGFDDLGRQYDKDGNLIDWWEPETNRTFSRKSQCLVEQYGNYTIPEIEMSLNGFKNLGENIADNGGIKIAYKGFIKWLERHEAEPSLPGLSYTPHQMFWISAATNWCTNYKKETLKQMVTSELHSPSYFRVVVPFMNSGYFARDFNCPLGSSMNPIYKCRVW